jgi:hypothetical protein
LCARARSVTLELGGGHAPAAAIMLSRKGGTEWLPMKEMTLFETNQLLRVQPFSKSASCRAASSSACSPSRADERDDALLERDIDVDRDVVEVLVEERRMRTACRRASAHPFTYSLTQVAAHKGKASAPTRRDVRAWPPLRK